MFGNKNLDTRLSEYMTDKNGDKTNTKTTVYRTLLWADVAFYQNAEKSVGNADVIYTFRLRFTSPKITIQAFRGQSLEWP